MVRTFIVEICVASWRWPSVPIDRLSNLPEDETRVARLVVPGEDPVWLWYRHIYASDDIDLIAISTIPG